VQKIGYNWRSTLSEFSRTAGLLAGFCITFVALVLGGKVADVPIDNTPLRFGQLTVLFFGLSISLFVASSQMLLQAKTFDVFSIPERYVKLLQGDCLMRNEEWADFEDRQTMKCRRKEEWGRRLYNLGVFLVFFGLFFAIAPYNYLIAFLISGLGIAFEIWQLKS
jgi:hypothetical protein